MAIITLLLFILCLCGTDVSASGIRRKTLWASHEWDQGKDAHDGLKLDVAIALRLSDMGSAVKSLLSISDPTSASYGHYWTAKEVAQRFSPTPHATSLTLDWLESFGIDKGRFTRSRDGGHIHLSVTVREASMLLGTKFHHFTNRDTEEQHIACHHYHLPRSLSGHIDYVTASASVSVHTRSSRHSKQIPITSSAHYAPESPVDCEKFTAPSCLRSMYNIPRENNPHPNNSFGIYQPSGLTWLPEDLDKFFGLFEPDLIGQRPRMERIDGGYTQTDYKLLPFNMEPDLDFEYAIALTAPQNITDIQVGDKHHLGNLNLMLAAFDKYYCDSLDLSIDYQSLDDLGKNETIDCGTVSPPKVLSISFGWPEAAFPPEYLHRQCYEFLKLGLMGITVIVASADAGTGSGLGPGFCINEETGAHNATTGKFSPSFPASCPWVTAVGGTQLVTQPHGNSSAARHVTSVGKSNPTNETTFYYTTPMNRTLSSGGGFSNIFTVPLYQAADIYRYSMHEYKHLSEIQGRYTATGRGYPDVAAQAYGYLTVVEDKVQVLHGSSASAPVFASIVALINGERLELGKSPVGFLNTALYLYPYVLNDITTGANEGCGVDPAFQAASGWDPVTGLGTPDYQRMRDLFVNRLYK